MSGSREAFYLAALDSPLQSLTPSAEAVVAHFTIRFEDTGGDIWLRIPDGVIRFWSEHGREAGPGPVELDAAYWLDRLDGWEWLSVPLAVLAGGVSLSLNEMMSLEPGDIILMPEGAPAGDPEAGPDRPGPAGVAHRHDLTGAGVLPVADGRYARISAFHTPTCGGHNVRQPARQPAETPPVKPTETPGELLTDLPSLEVELTASR